QHPPSSEEGQGKGGGLLPSEAGRLAEYVGRIHLDHLARRAVRMLAQHTEMWTGHILSGSAPFALPVAQRGEEDHLVAWFPRRIGRLEHDSGAISRDHSRRAGL